MEDYQQKDLTKGQKLADNITQIAGSWGFILCFIGFLIIWVAINCKSMFSDVFDPFPFILLNLLLSCLAAIQAPIILMSQNRQSEKDRARLEHDIRIDEESYQMLKEIIKILIK